MSKQINFSNPGEIDPDKVKQAVYSQIEFPLSDVQWEAIDTAFAQIWNVEIGIRGAFYYDEIVQSVYDQLISDQVLLEFERVERVVTIMLAHIEQSGGFLDDQPDENVLENSSSKQKPASGKAKMAFLITFSDSSTEIFSGEFSEAFRYARTKSNKFSVETANSKDVATPKKSNLKDRMNSSSGFPKVIKRKERDRNNPNDHSEEN